MTESSQPDQPGQTREPDPTRAIDLVLAAVVTILPPLGVLLALWLWITGLWRPGWAEFGVMFGMHLLCLIGVELGFHRLFSHRSYRPKRALKIALAVCGSMAFQGPVIWWASIHRKHHQFTDAAGDPHTMYQSTPDGRFSWRGALHAHLGWLWSARNIGRGGFAKYARDLYTDPDIFWIQMHYLYFMLAGFLLPTLLCALAYRTWQGALAGLLWGGLVRLFFTSHLQWSINSLAHGIGRRAYQTDDHSTNIGWLCLVTLGQSWHNNHHAFPTSAITGLDRWQLDPGAWILRLWQRLGWVDGMTIPDTASRARKRLAK
jgi:stearoyl-CoA desaturase (delta-9 desaturase)